MSDTKGCLGLVLTGPLRLKEGDYLGLLVGGGKFWEGDQEMAYSAHIKGLGGVREGQGLPMGFRRRNGHTAVLGKGAWP